MKICPQCKIEKDDSLFDKTHSQCKDCLKEYNKQYYKSNKNSLDAIHKNYVKENQDIIKEYQRNYYENNKNELLEYRRIYGKEKRENDLIFKLRTNVSNLIRMVLKTNSSSKNNNSILDFLPYSIQELREHLENQFEPWMNWDNYGKYDSKTWDDLNQVTWVWQIYHIIPQSKFEYTSMMDEQFQNCWALSNLRPYSARQNVMDGNRR